MIITTFYHRADSNHNYLLHFLAFTFRPPQHRHTGYTWQTALLFSAQTFLSFSWKFIFLLILQLIGAFIPQMQRCEVCLMLRHHCEGLKGNFDPVEISPLRRVSSNHFQVIHQSTSRAARLLNSSPSCFHPPFCRLCFQGGCGWMWLRSMSLRW